MRYAVSVATTASGPFRMVGETEATYLRLQGRPRRRAVLLPRRSRQRSGRTVFAGSAADRAGHRGVGERPSRAGHSGRRNKCNSCHVPHQALASPLMRTEVATDTPGQSATCLTCHDGKIASAGNVASGAKDSFALASGHALDTSASAGGLTSELRQLPRPSRDVEQEADASGGEGQRSGGFVEWHTRGASPVTTTPTPGIASTYPPSSAPQTDAAGYPVSGTWLGADHLQRRNQRASPHSRDDADGRLGPGRSPRRRATASTATPLIAAPTPTTGSRRTFRPTTAATLASDQTQGTYAAACASPVTAVSHPAGLRRRRSTSSSFVTSTGPIVGPPHRRPLAACCLSAHRFRATSVTTRTARSVATTR